MEIKRRTVLAGGTAAMLATTAASAEDAPAPNPLTISFPPDGKTVKVIEIQADADGHAIIKPVDMPADNSPYPLFKQFLTHKTSAVAIYKVPANLHIPASFDPAKRFLFILSGKTTIITRQEHRECPAGTILLFDGASDLAARSGPEGYTAIKINLAD